MWLQPFLRRIKTFFFADSWMDIFIQWLYSIPLPYWSKCILVGVLIAIIDIYPGNAKSYMDDLSAQIPFISFFIIPPYGLYLLLGLEKIRKDLVIKFYVTQEPDTFTKSQNFVSATLRWLFPLSRVFLISIYSLLLLAMLLSGELNLMLTIGAVVFTFMIAWSLSVKMIKTLSFIYKLRLQFIKINIFELSSLYYLSQSTQRIAIYLIPVAIIYEALIFPSDVIKSNSVDISALFLSRGIAVYIGLVLVLIAILIFAIPVLWIRKRIIDAKSELKSELGLKLQAAFEMQDNYAKEENFDKVKDFKDYVEILIFRKELIEKISEWPWETRVFREFSAAIFIPIVLSILQLYLTRWLGK